MKTNTDIHEYLRRKLLRSASILEIGSGPGTAELAKIFSANHGSVTAIEHDPEYLNLSEDVKYIHAPLVPYSDKYFRDATLWYDATKIFNLPRFDAIIVDGPKGSQGRGGFYTYLNNFKAGMYIFDDTHRMWEFRLAGRVADHFEVPFETYTDGLRWFSVVRPKEK